MNFEILPHYLTMLQACAAAAISWGSIAWTSRRISRRLFPDDVLSIQWCAASVIGIASTILLVQWLGLAGLLTRGWVAGSCMAWAMLVFLIVPNCGGEADFARTSEWCRRRVREGYGILACLLAIVVTQAAMRAIRCPPLSWDSLTYHAFLPARWVQLGEITPFAAPGGMDGYRALPCNMELVVAFVMLPFGGDLCANLVNLPLALMAAFAAYALARQLGAREGAAIWAPVLFCLSPACWSLITTQYNDILVAASLGAMALFLLRYLANKSMPDLVMACLATGIACGTKYTAIPAALVVILIIGLQEIRKSRGIGRGVARIFLVILIATTIGGWKYIDNWITLGNPIYPLRVCVAGHTLFAGSPMQDELILSTAKVARGGVGKVLWGMVSATQFSWGPKYIIVLMVGAAALLWGGGDRKLRWVLAAFLIVEAVTFLSPQDGMMERTRQMFPDSFYRMIGFSALIVACLAVSIIDRVRLPRGVGAIAVTLVALVDVYLGRYPQPLSVGEMGIVCALVLVGLWGFARSETIAKVYCELQLRRVQAPLLILCLVLGPLLADLLTQKRERARYAHYATSIDYHDIPRYLVDGWRACDEPTQPHTVAYVRRHKPDEIESMHRINTRWFFYPLLGSHLQNQVVYASIHEVRDLPSSPYFAALRDDVHEEAWIANLKRLRVDRLFVERGATPEESWIMRRSGVFSELTQGKNFRIFSVNIDALGRDGVLAARHEPTFAQ